jgi:hypothetical protein
VKLEIMSRRISQKEERKNCEKGGGHYDEQRQRKDIATGKIDRQLRSRRGSWLRKRRTQQGMASGICMGLQRDCCLRDENEQFIGYGDQSRMAWQSVEICI